MTSDGLKRLEFLSLILLLSLTGLSTSPLWGQAATLGGPLGTSAFFTTTDGVKLHYLDAGRGRPIVLVPGWTGTAENYWEPQIREFSREYRTIALDPRAHGRSEIAPASSEGYGFPRLAADIHELIEHLGLSDLVLVGASMGVKQVLAYVDRFGPDRVGAVVLVDGPVWNATIDACVNWAQSIKEMVSDRRGWIEGALQTWFSQPHPEEYLRRHMEARLTTPTSIAVWLGMVSFCSPESDTRDALSKLDQTSTPLLYAISSILSIALRPQADTLKGRIPGARVEVFDGAGHAIPVSVFVTTGIYRY